MPLGKGVRYRMVKTKKGENLRLAFKGKSRVVETKNMSTGATGHPSGGPKVKLKEYNE